MLTIRPEQVTALSRGLGKYQPEGVALRLREQGWEVDVERDPSGRITGWTLHDKAGGGARLIPGEASARFISRAGQQMDLSCDQDGRLTSITDGAGATSRFVWNDAGQLVQLVRPDGAIWRFEYDGNPQVQALHLPDGGRQDYRYNEARRLIGERDPTGAAAFFSYDEDHRLVSVTNRNGETTRAVFGEYSLPDRLHTADGIEHSFTYGRVSGQLESHYVNGHRFLVVERSKDEALVHRFHDDSWYALLYDGEGVPKEARNAHGTLTIKTNQHKHRLEETWAGLKTTFTRNKAGALTKLQRPDGQAIAYERDADHRVIGIRFGQLAVSVGYGRNGTVSGLSWSNGTTLAMVCDAVGRTVGWHLQPGDGSGAIRAAHAYDLRDRLTGTRLTTPDGREQISAYAYDAEGRLIDRTRDGQPRPARWDKNGNRLTYGAQRCTYGPADRLTSVDGVPVTHTLLGQVSQTMAPVGGVQCRWSGTGYLTQVDTPLGTAHYRYDAAGRRIRKQVGQTITNFHWAGQQLLSEVTRWPDGGQRRVDYVWWPDVQVPVGMIIDGEPYGLHVDHRMAVVAATDKQGRVVWLADYDPFGTADPIIAGLPQPWRLPGQYYDAETGWHYNQARYYDPSLGRYLSEDPLRHEGSAYNLYLYAGANPFTFADPQGAAIFCAILIGVAIGAAIGGGVEAYRQHKSGEPTDGWKIAGAAAVGGVIGGLSGGAGALVEGAFAGATAAGMAASVGAAAATGAGVGAVSGMASSAVEQCAKAAYEDKKIEPQKFVTNLLIDGLIGAGIGLITGGAGGALARRARMAADGAGDATSAGARQAAGAADSAPSSGARGAADDATSPASSSKPPDDAPPASSSKPPDDTPPANSSKPPDDGAGGSKPPDDGGAKPPDDGGGKPPGGDEPDGKIYREDNYAHSHQGAKPGRYKSHLDDEGNLRPANPDGDCTIGQHVRGSEPKKSQSPYTSFKGEKGAGKDYGGTKIEVDTKRLQADIDSGKVKDVEIVPHDKVLKEHDDAIAKAQTRYDNNPSPKNQERLDRALGDKANSARDKEVLVKGVIPKEYVTVTPPPGGA